MEKTQPPIS